MYLKQQNNLLIHKIWTRKTFNKWQVLVPYPYVVCIAYRDGISQTGAHPELGWHAWWQLVRNLQVIVDHFQTTSCCLNNQCCGKLENTWHILINVTASKTHIIIIREVQLKNVLFVWMWSGNSCTHCPNYHDESPPIIQSDNSEIITGVDNLGRYLDFIILWKGPQIFWRVTPDSAHLPVPGCG